MTTPLIQNTGVNTLPTVLALHPVRAAMSPQPVIGSAPTTTGHRDLGVLTALDGGHVAQTGVALIDVLTAGFPCQNIGATGKPTGIEKDTPSTRWTHVMAARRRRPQLPLVHNLTALRWRHSRAHRALADLDTARDDTLWPRVRDIGTAHRSKQTFLLAWPPAPATTSGGRYCPPPTPMPTTAIAGDWGTPPVPALVRGDG
jgi:DNA (cytosine-5)-methyltransferase 1